MVTHDIGDRVFRHGGGVTIYVKEHITSQIIPTTTSNTNDALEALCIKCTLHDTTYHICGIYHPPKATYEEASMISLIDV